MKAGNKLLIIALGIIFITGCTDRATPKELAIDVSEMDDDKVGKMKMILGKPIAMSADGKIYYYSTVPLSERVVIPQDDSYTGNMANVAGKVVVYGLIAAIEIGCKMLFAYK